MLELLDFLQTSMLRMSISPSFKNNVVGEIEGSRPTHMCNLPIKQKDYLQALIILIHYRISLGFFSLKLKL